MHRVRVVIQGHVQGVGFRYFALRQALALAVTGRVRNRADGAVEVLAEGERVVLEQLVEALQRGPRAARVTDLEAAWSEGPAEHPDFTITG